MNSDNLVDIVVAEENGMLVTQYIVDCGDCTNTVQMLESSSTKEIIKYTQGNITNIVEYYADGTIILDGSKVTVSMEPVLETSMVNAGATINGNSITPRDVSGETYWTQSCPYGTSSNYVSNQTIYKKANIALEQAIINITESAFKAIMKAVVSALLGSSASLWNSIFSVLYSTLKQETPQAEGLSAKIYRYYHKDADSTGYISAAKKMVSKYNCFWYSDTNYEGDVHTSVVYKCKTYY